ncbi:MAG: RNA-binding protein [Candidatus Aenigmarchaeota archaeon ex4484_52]|nr:MAG: RNA-binding protein [Candidatus Aenigmarchaeota archaeon ex4484_52]
MENTTLTKKYIQKNILQNIRLDKRKLDEYRNIEVKINEITNALGSCRLKLGNTEVLCGIKEEIGVPFDDTPDKGILITSVEYMPLADFDFETGRPDETAVEISRVVDRGIRESNCIDLKELCITKGEEVWKIYIDCYVLNFDGNLIDACLLASAIALKNAKMPQKEETKKEKIFPLIDFPVSITIRKHKNKLILDATKDEESVFNTRLTIIFTKKGNICAMQKGECDGFTQEEINNCLDMALKKQKQLRNTFDS